MPVKKKKVTKKDEKVETTSTRPVVSKEETKNAERKKEEVKKDVQGRVLEPLGPGQCYFESPDGRVLIGEDTKDQMWDRQMNNGRGGWINKMR